MSENMPGSSAEYSYQQRRTYFAPKVCKITSIEWCAGKNLMVCVNWNNRTRRVNIAKECRKRFGKLTPEVRATITKAAPKTVTIHTEVRSYGEHKKRYEHSIAPKEISAWLDSVEI